MPEAEVICIKYFTQRTWRLALMTFHMHCGGTYRRSLFSYPKLISKLYSVIWCLDTKKAKEYCHDPAT